MVIFSDQPNSPPRVSLALSRSPSQAHPKADHASLDSHKTAYRSLRAHSQLRAIAVPLALGKFLKLQRSGVSISVIFWGPSESQFPGKKAGETGSLSPSGFH